MALGLCGYTGYWIWAGSDLFVIFCLVVMNIWALYSAWKKDTWAAYYVVTILVIMFFTALFASLFDDDDVNWGSVVQWLIFLAVFLPFPICIGFWYCWGKECDRVRRQPLPPCLMPAEGWDAEKGEGDKARMTQASEKGKDNNRMTQATNRTRFKE